MVEEIYDISGSIKNRKGQEFKIETEGNQIIFSIIEDRKVTKFELPHEMRLALEDIRHHIARCAGHATKNNSIASRKQNG